MQQKSRLYELRNKILRPVSLRWSIYGHAMWPLPVQGVLSNIYSEFVVSEDNSEDEQAKQPLYIS
jgi:hypothetical protein